MLEEISKIIQDAELVLIGLGEEFNDIASIKRDTNYVEGRKKLEENSLLWLLPEYQASCRRTIPQGEQKIWAALTNLSEIVKRKNYFIVSVAMNDAIAEIPWNEGRLVMPCGAGKRKQCSAGCREILQELTRKDIEELEIAMKQVSENADMVKKPDLGKCPLCGEPLLLNNIYADSYNENGYLEQWHLYNKWLQGTLNRKVIILELGVGMQFPTVIRWPFEKVAFFNQKASFYRVNENLYQMSEELKNKGVSIPKNSIDWLCGM